MPGTFLKVHLSPPSSVYSNVFLNEAHPSSLIKHRLPGILSTHEPALFILALNAGAGICLIDASLVRTTVSGTQ